MSGHTPGPWRLENGHIYGADGESVCQAGPWPTPMISEYEDRARANARLIAAAPDLLQAMKAIVDHWRARRISITWIDGTDAPGNLDAGIAVIDRAEGRS